MKLEYMNQYNKIFRKVSRIFFIIGGLIILALLVASMVWRYSGSNKWEFLDEKNGVRVYTLKAPGSDIEQAKGVTQVSATLGSLVKFMQDPDVCDDVGCLASRMIERVDDQVQYYYFTYDLPLGFKTRDFMVKTQFYQDPRTRAVLVEFDAIPEKIPLEDCCFRVTEMNNSWKFTPIGNGRVEIEYIVNMNEGGFLPNLLINQEHRNLMFGVLPQLETWVNREKYKGAKYDFVKE